MWLIGSCPHKIGKNRNPLSNLKKTSSQNISCFLRVFLKVPLTLIHRQVIISYFQVITGWCHHFVFGLLKFKEACHKNLCIQKKTSTLFRHIGVSENRGIPQIIHFKKVFHYKPSILGYLYFRKHPYLLAILQEIYSISHGSTTTTVISI